MRLILVPALLLLLAACQSPTTTPSDDGPIASRSDVRVSPNDDREYRFLTLDNELKVLLISDDEADKSAASLTVFRGNYSDPADYPGLAHFLEHMLFIGTEKYPEPDGYFKFVQAHGGMANAYTSTDHTNYFFDVQPEHFPEALDRFAQFFIAPILDPAYVDREKNAVDSEYRLRIKEDSWRGFMASKAAVNPRHPYGQFNIGTLESLDKDVRTALIEFFENEYSADQMALVVVDNSSLDDMESLVAPMFAEIEDRDLDDFSTPEPLYTDGQLPMLLTHQSLKDNYSVAYNFPVPAMTPYYREKPGSFITNLLGHEGEGSIHSVLVKRGWATQLAAYHQDIDEDHGVISVDITLTPQGREHIPAITDLLFDYINLLKAQRPEKWRYEEQARVAELGFRFQEELPAATTARILSPSFAKVAAEDVIAQRFLMEKFDPALIERFLARLTPDNVMMEIVGPDVETDQVTEYFDVGYSIERGPIPRAPFETADLFLPERNPFLPESLDVLEDDPALPTLVVNRDDAEIWFDRDTEFGVPKATLNISLRNEGGLISLEDRAMAALYVRLVRDALNTLSYPALLAGVSYDISTPPKGFRISVGGYEDKQLVLLEEVLDRFANLEIKPERFEVLREEMVRALRNYKQESPANQTRKAQIDLMLDSSWPAEAQADYLEGIDPAGLDAWRREALDGVDAMALMLGNVTEDDAMALKDILDEHLNLADVTPSTPDVREIAGNWLHEVAIDHNDAAMVLHLQDPDDSFQSRARSALAAQMMRSEFFASLRTEQQLGYYVTVFSAPVYYRGGVTFLIQSPVAAPDVLESRTVAFVDGQVDAFRDMTAEQFERFKAGLISELTERDKNLGERTGRYWSDLDRDITTFDANRQMAEAVAELSQTEMTTFIEGLRERLDSERLLVFSRGKFETAPTAMAAMGSAAMGSE